jgi:hypothetical protein
MSGIELICDGQSQPLVYIIRSSFMPEQTSFLTPPDFKQQVGFVVYQGGGEIARHVHKEIERHLIGTSEVIVVRKGRCLLDVYDSNRQLVSTREMTVGDVALTVSGGHGFRMIENTVLLEVKQGPYVGVDEKERF